MENKPLVSVAMGIYNCADALEEAVQCIINQTYTNWELIMCDDCSSDNTYDTALKLVADGKTGFIVEPTDADAFADRIIKVLENPAAYSQSALEKAQLFTDRNVYSELKEIYF